MKVYVIAFLALFSVCLIAQSEVYKYIDESGNITYSDTRLDNSQKLELPPLTVVPRTNIEIETQAPESFTNKDEERRKIVKKMINEETKLLREKEKEYNNGEPERIGSERNYQRYLDRIERLENEIALHKEKKGALEHELMNLDNPN
jgi:septal ring factor EnvC (AmiA/AmiB activator)